ncbi:MAG TPA: efflux RND transporter periplasmic adaptor subunit [Cyclobacteriaceae bacterium]|jgi:HlyD family secretion protein|nr:efflux RND transporter periplasmic adaptor subunit [Cyclobacteriaceae bacterium]
MIKFNIKKLVFIGLLAFSCSSEKNNADASGSFEATETIVSSETTGKIMRFTIAEGDEVKAGQVIGIIDSTQLHLNKLQLLQNQKAILSGRPDIKTQLESLERQLETAISDKKRIENLVKGEVASSKQLDDANSRVTVLQSQIAAQKSILTSNTSTLNEQARTVSVQLALVEDQLRKCKIINPVEGTVLSTYANPFEITAAGKPLYKVANLTEINLKAFITSDQFSKIKIGQQVNVQVDSEGGKMKTYPGAVSWISNKAEFTPKTIQTKYERANLVYSIKVRVKNDGQLKIGMYGEVKFN